MSKAGTVGAVLLLAIALPCFLTLPWSVSRYDVQRSGEAGMVLAGPSLGEPLGTDDLGRSVLWRSLLGGAVSLGIGISAAVIAVGIGVLWGATAGYAGGRTDAAMMRVVDVLYGLPYILLVVMINLALFPAMLAALGFVFRGVGTADIAARLATLLIAIGGVSWLTMARVIRGQVLSLREQPFLEATRALGVGRWRTLRRHLLPNLVGPIVVYATLAVPAAILQESFLSFLGIGVRPPLPSWGNLATRGVEELPGLVMPQGAFRWWLLVVPCALLAATLMSLNFLGDALRDRLDPRRVR